tara:strand:+ start:1573 stop:1932 length:360 start_codon:yes stop_codon:yes gene_type:complete
MEIIASPITQTTRVEFNVNDVIKVYYGRLDNCRCGCAGEYYNSGDDDSKITDALHILNKYSNSSTETVLYDRFTYKKEPSELYFEIQTETRDFAEDSDEDYDYQQSDEGEVGYAFYIQD